MEGGSGQSCLKARAFGLLPAFRPNQALSGEESCVQWLDGREKREEAFDRIHRIDRTRGDGREREIFFTRPGRAAERCPPPEADELSGRHPACL
jgi:hypothetical protein